MRCMAFAQVACEQVTAVSDRPLYLAGERFGVSINVTIGGEPSPSRVAYVEIADTKHLAAQCMVKLTNGQGRGEIALPTQMHSGCYQLSVYTRAMRNFDADVFCRQLIGVVNGEQLSRNDDLRIIPSDDDAIVADIAPAQPSVPSNATIASPQYAPEIEGHIVMAKGSGENEASVVRSRLALIGKSASLYDGQRQSDGSFLYYTNDIYGQQTVLVNGFDAQGRMVPMQLQSPYAALLPQQLPTLTIHCQHEALRQRATKARQQALLNQQLDADTLQRVASFLSQEPDRLYDLDEWTQMNSVKELLLEFVKGIKREKHDGMSELYTYDASTRSYSKWPALVLLDGMPIYDIDEILSYDAHLIRYVQIYSRDYSFGNSICSGVISFITRSGRLTNYRLKDSEHLMRYAFPEE